MTTFHSVLRLALAIALTASCLRVRAAEPDMDVELFLAAAHERWKDLNPRVKAYRERLDQCRELVDVLGATYDAVLTNEPSRFRDTLIANYRRDRPTAIAEIINLETATREIRPDLEEARDFLHQQKYAAHRMLSGYKVLDDVLLSGFTAMVDAENISRPRPLPDPIPDPVPPAEVVDVSFLDKGLQQNVWYPVEVKVKNNNHYTERHVNVEIRVRSGPAKIRGSVFQKTKIPPGRTFLLTWEFMATGDGEFDIGARVVPQ